MRDLLASCLTEHAVRVSDAACSGSLRSSSSSSADAASVAGNVTPNDDPSAQIASSSVYKSTLSSGKSLLICLNSSENHSAGSSVAVAVTDDVSGFSSPGKLAAVRFHQLRKKKGSYYFVSGGLSAVTVYWDFSSAVGLFAPIPEAAENFYLAVTIDGELALLVGDQGFDIWKRIDCRELPIAKFSLMCRREQVQVSGLRSWRSTTWAKFAGDFGGSHEITIRCRGAELWVSVDKKKVIHVMRLNLNFRGNQTVFVDGLPVDVMWDMCGWWFDRPAGQAVFLFQTRSRLESRLWLEEGETVGFSLLIQAFRSS